MQEYILEPSEKIPKGYTTAYEIAKQLQRDVSTAHRLIRQLKGKNLVDTQVFKVRVGGRIQCIPHYKLKIKL